MAAQETPSFYDACVELANDIASCEQLTILERTPLLGKLQAIVRAHSDDVCARLDMIVSALHNATVPVKR